MDYNRIAMGNSAHSESIKKIVKTTTVDIKNQTPKELKPMAIEFTDANFETEVLQSDQPVLVDFGAEWCMPCKMIAPVIDSLTDKFDGKAKIGKLDTDNNRNTAIKYNITAIPTIMIFKDGQLAKQFVGMVPESDIASAINEILSEVLSE